MLKCRTPRTLIGSAKLTTFDVSLTDVIRVRGERHFKLIEKNQIDRSRDRGVGHYFKNSPNLKFIDILTLFTHIFKPFSPFKVIKRQLTDCNS